MKITILIENYLGEPLFSTSKPSIEMAVDELYRFERNYEKEIVIEANRLTHSYD